MGRIFKIQHPEIFQGNLHDKFYFEGWYFKLVDQTKKNVIACIVGISLDRKGNTSHCFIQFFNGVKLKISYFRFPVDQFWASDKRLEVKVGPNYFSPKKMILDIDQDGQRIQANLVFENTIPLPKDGIGHGIMGYYAYFVKIPCRHGLVSLDHHIQGKMTVNQEEIDFSGGKGYIEKDWGTSFPIAYLWMQSNHFDREGISIASSIATVPLFGTFIVGFFAVILFEGKVYRFTTYNHTKMDIKILEENHTHYLLKNKRYCLEIEGFKTQGMALPSPIKGAMKATISESLTSSIIVKFYRFENGQRTLLYEGKGEPAGLEIQATKKNFRLE